jgi:hypothetical protein
MGLWVLSSKHWAAPASAPVNLELVTTNSHTTPLEIVSELAGGPTKLEADGGQRGLEDRMLLRQVLTSRDAARSVGAAMAVSRWSTTRSGSIPSDSAWNVVMTR